jgi:3-oxoacyl-[acyl-carrier-protein] synthase-1
MYKIGDNIISSLGFTTAENYHAVKQSISGIKHYDAGTFGLPEAFMAALIDKNRLSAEFQKISPKEDYTDLEKAAILSVYSSNKEAQIDLASKKTIFILSTTKGNVDVLGMRYAMCDMRYAMSDMRYAMSDNEISEDRKSKIATSIYLWRIAELITEFFENPNTPIVVSNACISGVAAQLVAKRSLQSGKYDYAVVVGVDFLSKFVISGFQSFKALSPELCRPFDKNRCGLNLGEAAATMIFSRDMRLLDMRYENDYALVNGAIRNDATHISAPSRTGEGAFRALKNVLQNIDIHNIAFINAHGTATPYNDAMEMNAIARAGLQHIPVNALKSYFGHTLGAAGVVETIISMQALNEGVVLKTLGFEESEPIIINDELFSLRVCNKNMETDKKYFIKMMSGFGGVNATLLYAKNYCHELHEFTRI